MASQRGTQGSSRSAADWADRLRLKRRGREWIGPCPSCGGDDRFHVKDGDNGAIIGCRGCIDGQPEEAKKRAFSEIMAWAFPDSRWQPAQGSADRTYTRQHGGRAAPARVRAATASRGHPSADTAASEEARTAYARRIWAEAGEIPAAADHPARLWLAARNLWWPELPVPPMVRYIARLPTEGRAAAGYSPQIQGAIVGLMARPADWLAVWPELPSPQAAHCVFVDAQGRAALNADGRGWKLTYGPSKDTAILIGAPGSPHGLGVSEGLADGLALAARRWEAILCTLTTPRADGAAAEYAAASGGRVFLHMDNDEAGRKGGIALLAMLRSRGVLARASIPPHGYKDAAEYAADNPLPELAALRQDMDALMEPWENDGLPAWESLRLAARCLMDSTKGGSQ